MIYTAKDRILDTLTSCVTSSRDVTVSSADRTVLEMIPLNFLTSKTYKITPKTLLYDFYSLVNKWGTLVPPVGLNRQIFYLGFSKVNSFLKNEIGNSFFLLPPSIAEITSIVDQFKSKKSSGWDEVSMSVIKLTINNIAPVLTQICSLSFSQGVVPSEMKLAKVAPIFKCDAKDEFSNYRPISLLSNFSKIYWKTYVK